MEIIFSDSTSMLFYSALLQANAAIMALIGLYTIFKIQGLQSSIENTKFYFHAGNEMIRDYVVEFELKNLKEKIAYVEELKNLNIENNLLKRWVENEISIVSLKRGVITSTILVSIGIIENTILLLYSPTIHTLYPATEKYLALITLLFEIVLIITITYKVILSVFSEKNLGAFDKSYNNEELIEHYKNKHKEITELKKYFESIVPKNNRVTIEFKNNKELDRFEVYQTDDADHNTPGYIHWNLKIGSSELDSVMQTIKWTTKTLRILKSRLDAADCVHITSGDPVQIGFKKSGSGMYFYYIYNDPLPDSIRTEYKQTLGFSFFKDNVAWKYGSPIKSHEYV